MSAPMVVASLREIDPKTQTRRIITSRDPEHWDIQQTLSGSLDIEDRGNGWWRISGDAPTCYDGEVQMNDWSTDLRCPYGSAGDHLWVKETWRTSKQWDHLAPSALPIADEMIVSPYIAYEADGPSKELHGKTRVSIFMPKWASRITLEIVSVRVERLQEISEEDAKAEGVHVGQRATLPGAENRSCVICGQHRNRHIGKPNCCPQGMGTTYTSATWKGGYRWLWESINGPKSWDADPWVWVVEFRRLTPAAPQTPRQHHA